MDKTLEKERISEIIEAIMKVARGDYSVQIELSGKNDEIDSLAMGLNMMTDDIRNSIEELHRANEQLQASEEELKASNEELQATEEELRAVNEELQASNEELRETQEQLIRSEKLAAIGQLAGGVGHELRNPLGAIKNAVYYVKGKVAKSELGQKEPRVIEFLDIADDEVNSSNKIINDLLGFSRVGKPAVSPARIKGVIDDALSHLTIPENIEMVKKLDADLPEVNIDTDQIRQVLVNMIMNAVQAMPEGGRLTISVRERDKFLEVEISDTGCGIPKEAIGKIFDPLFTTRAKGIGLGLAVCKAVIERHEGNIEVESEVGKGATFTIRLPLKAE
jgi:signal transduction histidine kinase